MLCGGAEKWIVEDGAVPDGNSNSRINMKLGTRGRRIDEKVQSAVSVQNLGSCSRHATTFNDFLI